MKRIGLIGLIIVLTGCVSGGALSPEQQAEHDEPLVCKGKEQCDLFWQRVTFYISNNSRYKVQTLNENLIQTFSPTGGNTYLGYKITREPLGDNRFRIWIHAWCDNMFGCTPYKGEAVLSFKRYVRNGR